jgi:hypothetical protein
VKKMSFQGEATLHFNGDHHRICDGEAAEELMLQSVDPKVFCNCTRSNAAKVKSFSDWSFYQELKAQPGCASVEISQIYVDHSSWFLTGIQATYKTTFADGQTQMETEAPKHGFQRFRYRQYAHSMRSTFIVQDGEYITNLALRTVDHIVDRIIIVTNLRKVAFGSPGISGFPMHHLLPTYKSTQNEHVPFRRVVALAGVSSHMTEEIGCFSESMHWMRLKHLIIARKLVEQERADVMPTNLLKNPLEQKEDQTLSELVVNANDDVFHRVLSFLVPNTSGSLI